MWNASSFFPAAAAAAKSLQSCPTLCDPIDNNPPGSAIPGILQARILEWVAISFSNAWKWKVKVKSESEVAQSCPTLRDHMDCSLLGSSIHGIFQARVLELGATAFSFFPNRCQNRDFPSGPVARTPPSQCRDLGSIPLVRELGPTCHNQDSARILKISLAAMKIEDPVCPN